MIEFEDLSKRVADSSSSVSVFDQDAACGAVFGSLARTIHRGVGSHALLIAERGVGVNALLADFAHQLAKGKYPLWRERKLVRGDCRRLDAQAAAEYLLQLHSQIGTENGLIVALDGFSALFRNDSGRIPKHFILDVLGELRCQIVATLTPVEFEEYIAGDHDFSEIFEPIHVPEMTVETSIKFARQVAAGLGVRVRSPAPLVFNPAFVKQVQKRLQDVRMGLQFNRSAQAFH